MPDTTNMIQLSPHHYACPAGDGSYGLWVRANNGAFEHYIARGLGTADLDAIRAAWRAQREGSAA